MPPILNLNTADRQAFGPSYDRPADVHHLCELVRFGTLHLPPHPNWNGDILDWSSDPFGDRNWKFQHHTLRWLNPLRWAALDGDEQARQAWLRTARSWFEANVPAASSPSDFAWKDMADGNRAIQLSLGARLIGHENLGWYSELLSYHRDWLMDESHIVGKNHGLHQHAGLLVVSAVLCDEEGQATAHARMVEQFESTFDAQGGNDEGSAAYHQMNVRWWEQSWKRVELEGMTIPSTVRARQEAAGKVLAHLAQPDGSLPQIGDSARGKVTAGLSPQADYAATRGRQGTQPGATTMVLDRGYVLSRSGWGKTRPIVEESYLLLRHGADMRAHSHQDRGSVHIYAAGRPWLVDSGFHSYQTGDPTRDYLHSRQAHNLPSLLGVKHWDTAAVDLVRTTITDDVHDFEVVDRGYTSAEVRRRVTYLTGPDCWIVWDTTTADTATLAQRWHVDIGITCTRHDRGFELRDGNRSLNMTWLGATPRLQRHEAAEGDLQGWIGTRWKTLKPGTLITAEANGKRGRLVTLIAPSAPRELGVVRSYVTTTGVLDAVLMRGPRVWRVRIDGDTVNVVEQKRSW